MHAPPLTEPPHRRLAPADRAFARLMIATALYYIGYALFFLLPRRLVEIGANPSQVGFYTSLNGVLPVFVMPAIGIWADRIGPKRFVLSGYVLCTACAVGFLGLSALGLRLAALELAWGAGFSGAFLGGSILATHLAPPGKLAHRIGLFGAATLAMQALGPASGELLVARWGWNGLFWAGAGLMAIALAVGVGLGERVPPNDRGPQRTLLHLAAQPDLWLPLGVTFVAGATFAGALSFVPAQATALGAPRVRDFFMAYALSALVVRLLAGDLADRRGRARVAAPALVLYAIAAALVGLARTPLERGGAGMLFGAAHGLYYPALNALVLDRTGPSTRGRSMALYNLAFVLGGTCGNLGYGVLAKAAGYSAMFWGMAAMTAAAAAGTWRAGKEVGV